MPATRDDMMTAILRDLATMSEHLVVQLLPPDANELGQVQRPGAAALLGEIEQVLRLVPRLVEELERNPSATSVEVLWSRRPKGATASRKPGHYALAGERWIPTHWGQVVPVLEVDPKPLSYVLSVLGVLQARLDAWRVRLGVSLEGAIRERQASASRWAQEEADALNEVRLRTDAAHARLEAGARILRAAASSRLTAHASPPRPYPRGPAWSALRSVAARLGDPTESLRNHSALFHGHGASLADYPYLYERWCGLQILMAFERRDFEILADPLAALLLGGEIRLRDRATRRMQLTVHVTPRLLPGQAHASGLEAVGGERSPDYVIVGPGRGGLDAFVLDATLATAPEARAGKYRYLEDLAFSAPQRVAGRFAKRFPLRAWAMAPLDRVDCELAEAEGRCGTIPMSPFTGQAALTDWLDDVLAHVLAWSGSEPRPNAAEMVLEERAR